MEIINDYFRTLIFTKVDTKDNFCIYAAGIYTGLAGEAKRYIIIFVHESKSYKQRGNIYDFEWVSIQTRELPGSYRLNKQYWKLDRDLPDLKLSIVTREQDKSIYSFIDSSIYFLKCELIHNPKKKTIYQYHNKITLSGAIETFNMVISLIPSKMPRYPKIEHQTVPHTYIKDVDDDIDDSYEILN